MERWKRDFWDFMFPIDKTELNYEKAISLKNDHIPKKLYKYYSFDKDEHNLENLKSDQLFLSKALDFNDPYDCALTGNEELLKQDNVKRSSKSFLDTISEAKNLYFSENDILELKNSTNIYTTLVELLKKQGIPATKSEEQDFINKLKQFQTHTISDLYSKINRDTDICSLSELKDSILMWSHYTDKHTGFCIEYSLVNYAYNINLYPVIYQKKLFDITPYFLNKFNDYNKFAFSAPIILKAKEWHYEKEWRIIVAAENIQRQPFPAPEISAIYCGCRITPENQQILADIAKEKSVSLFKERLSENEFKLEFEEIIQ